MKHAWKRTKARNIVSAWKSWVARHLTLDYTFEIKLSERDLNNPRTQLLLESGLAQSDSMKRTALQGTASGDRNGAFSHSSDQILAASSNGETYEPFKRWVCRDETVTRFAIRSAKPVT